MYGGKRGERMIETVNYHHGFRCGSSPKLVCFPSAHVLPYNACQMQLLL